MTYWLDESCMIVTWYLHHRYIVGNLMVKWLFYHEFHTWHIMGLWWLEDYRVLVMSRVIWCLYAACMLVVWWSCGGYMVAISRFIWWLYHELYVGCMVVQYYQREVCLYKAIWWFIWLSKHCFVIVTWWCRAMWCLFMVDISLQQIVKANNVGQL